MDEPVPKDPLVLAAGWLFPLSCLAMFYPWMYQVSNAQHRLVWELWGVDVRIFLGCLLVNGFLGSLLVRKGTPPRTLWLYGILWSVGAFVAFLVQTFGAFVIYYEA